MRSYITCKIPVKFSLTPNKNGICFTEESALKACKNFCNSPIVQNEKCIGVMKDNQYIRKESDCLIVDTDAILWLEVNPEVIVYKAEKIDGGIVITDFNFLSINMEGDKN